VASVSCRNCFYAYPPAIRRSNLQHRSKEGQKRKSGAAIAADELAIVFVIESRLRRDCDVFSRFWSDTEECVRGSAGQSMSYRAKDAVLWEDLKTESFIVARSEIGATIRNYSLSGLRRFIKRPDIRQSPVARETLIHLVGLGNASA